MFPAASPDANSLASGETRLDALLALGVVLVYCALQVILFAAHDPWLDEAQAWLWAKNLSRPLDWMIIPGEGHPPLWYWLLKVLSLFLDFNQARVFGLLMALVNALLLWRLLGRDPVLLFAMLGSFVLLQFWGHHFRPYSIVFSCMLVALLLDREGRYVAATWISALACGFHFFAGLLFAFWLVYQFSKGTALRALLGPAALALCFGALALLSGLGNGTIGPAIPDLLAGTLHNLAWPAMIAPLRVPLVALATLLAVAVAFYRHKLILATMLALLIAFSLGTAAIYGKYPWHMAFMTMLCFMAVMLVGLEGRRWFLLMLLAPQVVFGVAGVAHRLSNPTWSAQDLYAAIVTDAGAGFVPERQLVAWPDLAGVSLAAVHDIKLVSGNDGSLLGPINWRDREPGAIDTALFERAEPYWLICGNDCPDLLSVLAGHGRSPSLLAQKTSVDNGEFYAYRVD